MPVTKVYKALHDFFFFLLSNVYQLYGFISVLYNTRWETLDSHLWPTHSMFSDCSKWRYLLKLYKGFHGILRVFWRCHILTRCRLEKAPSFSQKHSCPILKPLGATLTPAHLCLFSQILGDKSKDHMQTGNDRLALGLLQRERNQSYLSLIYFNAKTVYWVQKQYFSLPPKILLQHLQYHPRYQISATTAAAVIQDLFISPIVMYVCIWARWWLHTF